MKTLHSKRQSLISNSIIIYEFSLAARRNSFFGAALSSRAANRVHKNANLRGAFITIKIQFHEGIFFWHKNRFFFLFTHASSTVKLRFDNFCTISHRFHHHTRFIKSKKLCQYRNFLRTIHKIFLIRFFAIYFRSLFAVRSTRKLKLICFAPISLSNWDNIHYHHVAFYVKWWKCTMLRAREKNTVRRVYFRAERKKGSRRKTRKKSF